MVERENIIGIESGVLANVDKRRRGIGRQRTKIGKEVVGDGGGENRRGGVRVERVGGEVGGEQQRNIAQGEEYRLISIVNTFVIGLGAGNGGVVALQYSQVIGFGG